VTSQEPCRARCLGGSSLGPNTRAIDVAKGAPSSVDAQRPGILADLLCTSLGAEAADAQLSDAGEPRNSDKSTSMGSQLSALSLWQGLVTSVNGGLAGADFGRYVDFLSAGRSNADSVGVSRGARVRGQRFYLQLITHEVWRRAETTQGAAARGPLTMCGRWRRLSAASLWGTAGDLYRPRFAMARLVSDSSPLCLALLSSGSTYCVH